MVHSTVFDVISPCIAAFDGVCYIRRRKREKAAQRRNAFMNTIKSPNPGDDLRTLQAQLCEAYDAENMPLVMEISQKIDDFQISLWSQLQPCCD